MMVAVPVVAVAEAVSVSVDEPPEFTAAGANDAVTPLGRPLALRAMLSAWPETIAVETVDVPLAPCWTLTLAGLALIEKSGGGPPLKVTSSNSV